MATMNKSLLRLINLIEQWRINSMALIHYHRDKHEKAQFSDMLGNLTATGKEAFWK